MKRFLVLGSLTNEKSLKSPFSWQSCFTKVETVTCYLHELLRTDQHKKKKNGRTYFVSSWSLVFTVNRDSTVTTFHLKKDRWNCPFKKNYRQEKWPIVTGISVFHTQNLHTSGESPIPCNFCCEQGDTVWTPFIPLTINTTDRVLHKSILCR